MSTKLKLFREWVHQHQMEAAQMRKQLQTQGNPMGERVAFGKAAAFVEVINELDRIMAPKTKKKLESESL